MMTADAPAMPDTLRYNRRMGFAITAFTGKIGDFDD
jgi:hypothetical protein